MSEFLSRKIIASTLIVALGGASASACSASESKEPAKSAPSASASKPPETCNGLPNYRIAGTSSKEGEAMLQVANGTTCETPLYDPNTLKGTGSSIGPATTFFACVPDWGKPLAFRVTITSAYNLGPTGMVNLSYEGMSQWTANQDVPYCAD